MKSHKLRLENLGKIEALTDNQQVAITLYNQDNHLVLSGSAGTGKTYLAMRLALEDVLDRETEYDRVVIVRSIVPTRDIGFLPGNAEEKMEAYIGPYKSICEEVFDDHEAYEKLITSRQLEIISTS